MASIQLEFFGVARRRTNVASVNLNADNLSEVVAQLKQLFPTLEELCIHNGQLVSGWLLNVNGEAFTRDLSTPLNDDDQVLLIPADAGG